MEVLYRQAESKTSEHFGRGFSLFRLTLDQTAAAFFFLHQSSRANPTRPLAKRGSATRTTTRG
jgi:hypothetical protein